MVTSLRSKWAAGKARGGRISKSIRNRSGGCRTRPVSIQIWALYRQSGSDRLEKQPTDPATAGRHHHYMRDGTLSATEEFCGAKSFPHVPKTRSPKSPSTGKNYFP